MASKSKKHKQRRPAGSALDRVQSLLERGDYKQALKEARVAYRQKPTVEFRAFLEHAYMGRAQELVRRGQREDARRIVTELQQLGVTELSVQTALPDMLLSVGLLNQLPRDEAGVSEEERQRLNVKAADLAVLHPEVSPKEMPEIQAGARAIREALAALYRGDEAAATACLQNLPRQSPFADWKYFARGLAAYYRHDATEMSANWSRLDADRPAAKIAAPLRAMSGDVTVAQDHRLAAKISRLEKMAIDQAVLSQLKRIRQAVADGEWKDAYKSLRQVRGGLSKLDANLFHRAVSWLTGVLVSGGRGEEVERLARVVEGVPLDPRWNRARAMALEESEFEEEQVSTFWRRYLDDLDEVRVLSGQERDVARGLIWLRLAEEHADEAAEYRMCRCGADHTPDIESAESDALEAYERSLSFLPTHAPAYEQLAEFYDECGREDEIPRAYQRLLEHAPDNVDALLNLASHFVKNDEPRTALEYAQRARRQKPLDNTVREFERTCHLGAVRQFARAGDIEKAREHLAAADQLGPEQKDDFDILARKAVLETKAGCVEAAQGFIQRAEETLEELTAFWMAMAIQSSRYGLPREETWLYEKRWQDSLKRRCRSETACLMCKMLTAHLAINQEYFNRDEHVTIVLNYVRRCTRVKWQPDDLWQVCEFLQAVDEKVLLEKFVKQGMRKCPDVASFHALAGILEIDKGPLKCNRLLAQISLRKAITLNEASPNPRDKQLIERVRHALALLEHHEGHYYEDDEDDGYEEDEYDGPDAHEPPHQNGMSVGEMRKIIQDACDRMGLDPEDVLDQLSGGNVKGKR